MVCLHNYPSLQFFVQSTNVFPLFTELKFQRSLNNREYPQLDPPHPQIFESSNSSNNFNGLPLTPGIVMEDVNSPNTPQTPHLHKQGIVISPSLKLSVLYFYVGDARNTQKTHHIQSITDIITANNPRRKSQIPVNTIIDIPDGEQSHNKHKETKQDKSNEIYPQILTKKDIIIIASASLILFVLAIIVVIVLVVTLELS